MPKYRQISEEYNSAGQFMPPNPYGHDVSVGREMEGGDDEDMEMQLQADIGTDPIKAIDEARINFDTAWKIMPRILQKLGDTGNFKFVGEGGDGLAFQVGNKIYKLTDSVSEVNDSIKIIGKRNAHLADVYSVHRLTNSAIAQGIYVIVLEKLRIERKLMAQLEDSTREILTDLFGQKKYQYENWAMILTSYKDNKAEYQEKYAEQIAAGFKDHPQEKYYFDSLLKIIDELNQHGVKSMDLVYLNLGFKSNGNIAFFDLGRGGDNELPNSDTLKLENKIFERVMTFMPHSKAVSVKKKCRLGGNGDGTSKPCNQGDINALEMTKIHEGDQVDGFYRYDAGQELADMTEVDAFHGTNGKGFTAFSIDKVGSGDGRELGGWGIYFTDDAQVASIYGDTILKVQLRDGNYFDFDETLDDGIASYIIGRGRSNGLTDEDIAQFESDFYDEGYRYDTTNRQVYDWLAGCLGTTKAASFFLKKMGYIGNKMADKTNPDATNYILFDPKDVKIVDESEEDLYEVTPNNSMYIPEGKDQKVEYGVVMLNVDVKGWDKITSVIKKEDIYDKPTFGIEKNPHVTILYGFHAGVKAEQTKEIIEKIIDIKKPIEITLTDISFFEVKGQEYDVVKFDVECDILHKLNKALRELPHTSSFPDYHPHMTISYVKKGTAEKYKKKLKKEIKMKSDHLVFSTKKEEKTRLNEVVANQQSDLKKWISNSEMVKSDGTPIVFYHGSRYTFDIFDKSMIGKATDPGWLGEGFYFYTDMHEAAQYGKVRAYYLNIQNPYFASDEDNRRLSDLNSKEASREFTENLKSEGYDGVYYNGNLRGETVVFEPDQIRNADEEMENLNETILKKVLENLTKVRTLHTLHENNIVPVNSLPFKADIEQAGGKIYSVGGAVRDGLLNKPSKDLDLLITGLPMDKLEQILAKYGKVDNVGKSFGIIKFNTPQFGELDIAIPRTERANGQGGYQGFEVTSDHELPIEKDLERRDFTINAIAKDSDGNLIDPYNGQQDLDAKLIRMVNPQAFKDDPLRMIRAVQFAARFGFNIEPETMQAIKDNASRIKEISPERILIEFDKIVKKGDPVLGAKLLIESGLYQNIFGAEPNVNFAELGKAKSMGEFIFLLSAGAVKSASEFFKNNLKGDLDTYNEIRAYELAYSKPVKVNDVQTKLNIFGMFKTYPKSLESQIIPFEMKENVKQMQELGMPFSMKDLQINGNDLLAMGYTGVQIGDLLKKLVVDIFSGKLRNNRELLLRHLTPNIPEV